MIGPLGLVESPGKIYGRPVQGEKLILIGAKGSCKHISARKYVGENA